MEITDLSASELARALASRQVSSREVMLAYLRRIADFNPVYNALVSLRVVSLVNSHFTDRFVLHCLTGQFRSAVTQ